MYVVVNRSFFLCFLNLLCNQKNRTPDFIPLVLEKGLDQMLQDNMVTIPDGAAVAMAQSLARNEGILTVSYSF